MAQVLDFVMQSYTAHSKPLNGARCVNFFPEAELQDAASKSPVGIWGCPGLSPFAATSDRHIRAIDMMNGVVYAVGDRHFWQINPDGRVVNLGSHQANTPISIDNNGIQVVWVDGSTGWYWSATTGVQQILDPNFFPSATVTYFDGYFCFPRYGTKQFFLSPLFGITPFDASQFASKEATSDLLQAIANSHEQLYLFGQERTEIWFDAGNPPPSFPFQRSDGAIIQRGTIAPHSIVLEDNTLFFLGDDGMFYRVQGFVPERISTHAVENAWATYPTLTDCQAFVYTVFGHKMVTLVFPQAKATWVVDLSTRRWHERESWLGTSADDSIGRWRGSCAIAAYNRVLVGDSQTGQIGQLNFNGFTEFGYPMRGLLDGPPIHKDRRRIFMKRFELDVESGVGIPEVAQDSPQSYCLNPVIITKPTTLSIDQLAGVADNFATGAFSVWANLAGADATGFILDGPGFDLEVTLTQVVLTLADAAGGAVLSAAYPFSNWANWVNLLVSFDAPNQLVQVWANTTVAGVLVETQLTASSLTWSSALPVTGLGAWQLSVV
jgi:hypothetical protein